MLLMIDDTHRDMVLATDKTQNEGYMPDSSRRVDFLTSYPVALPITPEDEKRKS